MTQAAPPTPDPNDTVLPLPTTALTAIDDLDDWQEPEAFVGSVGRTMFDAPGSKDNTLTVLLPADQVQQVPAQSMFARRQPPRRPQLPRHRGRGSLC